MCKEHQSLEELKDRLMREYYDSKYNINSKYEEELHNELSIIFNYIFEEEVDNYVHKMRLYSKLSLLMIRDFILDIMHIVNNYISEKYHIQNFELKNRNEDILLKKFHSKMESIKNTKDERLIRWVTDELLEQTDFIESTFFINHTDEFLRVEKILTNSKRELEELNFTIEPRYIINIIQIFYNFKDKLKKNNFIGENNRIIKIILNEITKENNEWEIKNNKAEKQVKYYFDDKEILEERKISVKDQFKGRKDIKKKFYIKGGKDKHD